MNNQMQINNKTEELPLKIKIQDLTCSDCRNGGLLFFLRTFTME